VWHLPAVPSRRGYVLRESVIPRSDDRWGFAEYLRTSERSAIPLPDGVDPVDIAPHADAGITAYHAVKKAVDELNPGDPAIVIGVGGLGHIGLQCLDAMSAADIIALDIKEAARDLAADLGARYTVDPTSEDVSAAIDDITDGHGAEQVIDFVGADVTTGYAPDVIAPVAIIISLGTGDIFMSHHRHLLMQSLHIVERLSDNTLNCRNWFDWSSVATLNYGRVDMTLALSILLLNSLNMVKSKDERL